MHTNRLCALFCVCFILCVHYFDYGKIMHTLFFFVCVIMIILGISFISVSVKLCKSYYHLILKRGAQKLYRNALIVDFVLKRTYMPIIYCLVAVRL